MAVSDWRFRFAAFSVVFLSAVSIIPDATAFQGPHADFVTMEDGLRIDMDVRWPDGSPPEGGWPAIILAHSRRGDKEHLAREAVHYADRGYVTLAYSCRGDGASTEGGNAEDTSAATRGRDVVALKRWLIEGLPGAAQPADVRVNPERIGMTGASQGALNTWYGALTGGEFAAVVPQFFHTRL